ncbi:hypothetical protein KUTeg_002770 [Tegillarca granosa]|uniref:Uncharacterized protein n=1 Tax=Tegillarca granosa TaxID=220873 RepID=A0ABQ9FTT3_TEGGR|nr:hypothetical protein KUTeg_002770 [Tegillarca granosa]
MAASNKLTNSGVNIIEIFTKLSHILAIFGFILHLIGFATPFWRVLPFRWKGLNDEDEDNLLGFDEGLWRKCANGLCSSVEVAGRVLFLLLGVITYGASVNLGLSWSFGLATVGGLLLGIAGGLLLVAFVKHQSAPF